MRRVLVWLCLIALVGAGGGWVLSAPPSPPEAGSLPDGDAEAGKLVFAAAGCASCHVAEGAETGPDAVPVLAGGHGFATDFGTFYAPNISPHPEAGIGAWSDEAIVHAVQAGISPSGQYYYPVFPTHAYALADIQDITNLVAYLRTLPEDATPSRAHDLGFPFNIRRGMWGWRQLFGAAVYSGPSGDEVLDRGRYLVEALSHCAECHTPRNALGGLDRSRWMAGAPLPTGDGRVPGITPAQLDWSTSDIAAYLGSGFTPDFDVVGGEMVDVVDNLSQLSEADRVAIATYVSALPPAE